MPARLLHRFELGGKRYVIDPETCFCFECDEISWDVLEHFPEAPVNRVFHLLEGKHSRKELEEVIGELEWLRGSKSILSPPKLEQQQKAFELERGLRRLDLRLGDATTPAVPTAQRPGWFKKAAPVATATESPLATRVRRAAALLLARGTTNAPLRLDVCWEKAPTSADEVLAALREAFSLAKLGGKTLHIAPRVLATLDDARATYSVVCAQPEHLDAALDALPRAASGPRAVAKAFAALPEGTHGEVLLAPRGAAFADTVKALHAAGFTAIEIDLDTAYAAAEPVAVTRELQHCAERYAQDLLKGDYYRLEPIAGIFNRIYLGMPVRRTDPAGLSILAIDATGGIYPAAAFFARDEHRIGGLDGDTFDVARLARYEDIGAVTTPDCFRCWARNLCGGGSAAVHLARTGDFRAPDPTWCDAQRAWLESAIATFNQLSGAGVNFARVYGQLGKAARPSLFTMVKAAFQMNIGLRPLGEADAELLTKWQNFNDAAYFTFNETGLLLATKYDREMDALYPKGYEFEFMLLRRNGAPMGLMRLRPLAMPGTAMAWVYLKDPNDYAEESVRKSFRFLLDEAAKQQGIQRLIVPCGPFDTGLAPFLTATGFIPAGQQREALYLRATYHDIAWHTVSLSR